MDLLLFCAEKYLICLQKVQDYILDITTISSLNFIP